MEICRGEQLQTYTRNIPGVLQRIGSTEEYTWT
jgi:hypothetical protein